MSDAEVIVSGFLGAQMTAPWVVYTDHDCQPVALKPPPWALPQREPSDIIDRIDELVDEQLAVYENRSGYDHNVNQDLCHHCGRHWHGLPITERIDSMYRVGSYDEAYRLTEDDSRLLCRGSDFIGPMPPERKPGALGGWHQVGTLSEEGVHYRPSIISVTIGGQDLITNARYVYTRGTWHLETEPEGPVEPPPPQEPPVHCPRNNEPPTFGGPTPAARDGRTALINRLRELAR